MHIPLEYRIAQLFRIRLLLCISLMLGVTQALLSKVARTTEQPFAVLTRARNAPIGRLKKKKKDVNHSV